MRNALLAGTGVLALATWTAAEAAPILPGSTFGPVISSKRTDAIEEIGAYELAASWDGTKETEIFEWFFTFGIPPFTSQRLFDVPEPFQSSTGQLPTRDAFFKFLDPTGEDIFFGPNDPGPPLLLSGLYTAQWTFTGIVGAGSFNRAFRFDFQPVPLPAGLPMLAVALGGLAIHRRRRQPA